MLAGEPWGRPSEKEALLLFRKVCSDLSLGLGLAEASVVSGSASGSALGSSHLLLLRARPWSLSFSSAFLLSFGPTDEARPAAPGAGEDDRGPHGEERCPLETRPAHAGAPPPLGGLGGRAAVLPVAFSGTSLGERRAGAELGLAGRPGALGGVSEGTLEFSSSFLAASGAAGLDVLAGAGASGLFVLGLGGRGVGPVGPVGPRVALTPLTPPVAGTPGVTPLAGVGTLGHRPMGCPRTSKRSFSFSVLFGCTGGRDPLDRWLSDLAVAGKKRSALALCPQRVGLPRPVGVLGAETPSRPEGARTVLLGGVLRCGLGGLGFVSASLVEELELLGLGESWGSTWRLQGQKVFFFRKELGAEVPA